jgi:flagellar biosynthesis/type III secretory pathway protein FliH
VDVDVSTRNAEAAEAQIDAFIRRMDTKRKDNEGERLERELWQESVERFHQQARQENREKWRRFHEGMCVLHSQLAAEHQEKAKLLDEGRTGEDSEADTGAA